jgi:hypothetical protein
MDRLAGQGKEENRLVKAGLGLLSVIVQLDWDNFKTMPALL